MVMKISGVYKITNTVTNDCYVGSSKNIKRRWAEHKSPSSWKKQPSSPMYLDMQKYGIDKFDFQILANVEPDQLKEAEQQFIETLHPTYNSNRANGIDIERRKKHDKEYKKEYMKEYYQKNKEHVKEYQKEYRKKYRQSEI